MLKVLVLQKAPVTDHYYHIWHYIDPVAIIRGRERINGKEKNSKQSSDMQICSWIQSFLFGSKTVILMKPSESHWEGKSLFGKLRHVNRDKEPQLHTAFQGVTSRRGWEPLVYSLIIKWFFFKIIIYHNHLLISADAHYSSTMQCTKTRRSNSQLEKMNCWWWWNELQKNLGK